MGEVEFISETNVGILNRKNPKIINNCNKTSKGTKKFAQKKIAKKTPSQFCQVLSIEFDPEECLDKLLLFDLEKTSAENIFDKIIEKLPDNDTYYIEHRHETNAFCERKDKKTN